MSILLIGCGGFLGAIARYLISYALPVSGGFPWPTLIVNVLGCLFIALLSQTWSSQNSVWLFCATGFLGAFTTFSAFGLESYRLIQNQNYSLAFANVGANVLLGFLMFFIVAKLS